MGSRGGGYGWDRMRNSRRRRHNDVYSTYLLYSRRRCVEVPSRSAWGRSAGHSKESNSLSLDFSLRCRELLSESTAGAAIQLIGVLVQGNGYQPHAAVSSALASSESGAFSG
jgi:hypothetical protein